MNIMYKNQCSMTKIGFKLTISPFDYQIFTAPLTEPLRVDHVQYSPHTTINNKFEHGEDVDGQAPTRAPVIARGTKPHFSSHTSTTTRAPPSLCDFSPTIFSNGKLERGFYVDHRRVKVAALSFRELRSSLPKQLAPAPLLG
jgi:hypothetical protein